MSTVNSQQQIQPAPPPPPPPVEKKEPQNQELYGPPAPRITNAPATSDAKGTETASPANPSPAQQSRDNHPTARESIDATERALTDVSKAYNESAEGKAAIQKAMDEVRKPVNEGYGDDQFKNIGKTQAAIGELRQQVDNGKITDADAKTKLSELTTSFENEYKRVATAQGENAKVGKLVNNVARTGTVIAAGVGGSVAGGGFNPLTGFAAASAAGSGYDLASQALFTGKEGNQFVDKQVQEGNSLGGVLGRSIKGEVLTGSDVARGAIGSVSDGINGAYAGAGVNAGARSAATSFFGKGVAAATATAPLAVAKTGYDVTAQTADIALNDKIPNAGDNSEPGVPDKQTLIQQTIAKAPVQLAANISGNFFGGATQISNTAANTAIQISVDGTTNLAQRSVENAIAGKGFGVNGYDVAEAYSSAGVTNAATRLATSSGTSDAGTQTSALTKPGDLSSKTSGDTPNGRTASPSETVGGLNKALDSFKKGEIGQQEFEVALADAQSQYRARQEPSAAPALGAIANRSVAAERSGDGATPPTTAANTKSKTYDDGARVEYKEIDNPAVQRKLDSYDDNRMGAIFQKQAISPELQMGDGTKYQAIPVSAKEGTIPSLGEMRVLSETLATSGAKGVEVGLATKIGNPNDALLVIGTENRLPVPDGYRLAAHTHPHNSPPSPEDFNVSMRPLVIPQDGQSVKLGTNVENFTTTRVYGSDKATPSGKDIASNAAAREMTPWEPHGAAEPDIFQKSVHFNTDFYEQGGKKNIELSIKLDEQGGIVFEKAFDPNNLKGDAKATDAAIKAAEKKFDTDPAWRQSLLNTANKGVDTLATTQGEFAASNKMQNLEDGIVKAMEQKGQTPASVPWQVKSTGLDEAIDKGLHFSTVSPSKSTVELKATVVDGKISFEPTSNGSAKSKSDIDGAIASAKEKLETDPAWRKSLLTESTKAMNDFEAAGNTAIAQNRKPDASLEDRAIAMMDIEAAIQSVINDRR